MATIAGSCLRVSPKKAEIEVDWDKIAKPDDATPVQRREWRRTEDRNETYPVLQKVDFAVMHDPALLPLTLSANRGPFLVHARHQTGRPRHVISIFRKDLKQRSLLVFHALKLKCANQSQQQQRPR